MTGERMVRVPAEALERLLARTPQETFPPDARSYCGICEQWLPDHSPICPIPTFRTALAAAQPAPAPAAGAELWGVLESVHGDLAAALKASSISSALTQQYMGSAFDTVTDALACKEESAPTAPAPAGLSWGSGYDAGMEKAAGILERYALTGESPDTPPLGLLDAMDAIKKCRHSTPPNGTESVQDFHITPTPQQFLQGEPTTQLQRVMAHLALMPDLFALGLHDRRVVACALAYLAQSQAEGSKA